MNHRLGGVAWSADLEQCGPTMDYDKWKAGDLSNTCKTEAWSQVTFPEPMTVYGMSLIGKGGAG